MLRAGSSSCLQCPSLRPTLASEYLDLDIVDFLIIHKEGFDLLQQFWI